MTRPKRVLVLWLALAWLLVPGRAEAHIMGVSRGEYAISSDGVVATLVFRADELGETPEEVIADTTIEVGSKRCEVTKTSSSFDPPDGVRIVGRYACSGPSGAAFHLHAGFLERLPGGHAHEATVIGSDGTRSDHLLVLARPDVTLDARQPHEPSGIFGFVRAGVEHILTGPDHLLFLLGLVLLPRSAAPDPRKRVRALLVVLTAFTVGHSISLALATLLGVTPSSRVVESLVALSVAYVGGENLFAAERSETRRYLLTFPFGLVHGFAFASGLLLVGLPRSALPKALLGFNVGVELGQIGVMALILPGLLVLATRKPRVYDHLRVGLSIVVLASGLVWFALRAFF